MYRIVIAALAASLALASVSAFAKEVQLNDQERMDLRSRADGYQREGRHDRTTEMRGSMRHMAHATGAKMHKAKYKAKRKAHRMHRRMADRTR